jgi:hypothetical protein
MRPKWFLRELVSCIPPQKMLTFVGGAKSCGGDPPARGFVETKSPRLVRTVRTLRFSAVALVFPVCGVLVSSGEDAPRRPPSGRASIHGPEPSRRCRRPDDDEEPPVLRRIAAGFDRQVRPIGPVHVGSRHGRNDRPAPPTPISLRREGAPTQRASRLVHRSSVRPWRGAVARGCSVCERVVNVAPEVGWTPP